MDLHTWRGMEGEELQLYFPLSRKITVKKVSENSFALEDDPEYKYQLICKARLQQTRRNHVGSFLIYWRS